MKIIKIIFLTVILNILNIQNCFSISNKPGIEDLEEKILDLEKRVFFLEKKSYNDAKQKNELTENANQTGIEFNDGKGIINNDNNISDNTPPLNVLILFFLEYFLTFFFDFLFFLDIFTIFLIF